jgi:hypothetical protein
LGNSAAGPLNKSCFSLRFAAPMRFNASGAEVRNLGSQSMHHCGRERLGLGIRLAVVLVIGLSARTEAHNERWPPPPADQNVIISNGGLSVTFNIAWGASVIGIADKNVSGGLNIVDSNDVGRELQPCQFLMSTINGRKEMIQNPTQAGAQGGKQPFYQHPHGVAFPQRGSPVVRWNSSADHFHAVIKPLEYNAGTPSNWVYVEDARIDPQGVAHFRYTFYNHESKTYSLIAIIPTLYTDRTGTYMYPLVSPYGPEGAALRKEASPTWPVQTVTGAPLWPQKKVDSKGWIANVDDTDGIGIFYTTPLGLGQQYGNYEDVGVSDRMPLAQTYVAAFDTSYPGEIFSVDFSLLVSTPQLGPRLISKQPAAVYKILRNSPPAAPQGAP